MIRSAYLFRLMFGRTGSGLGRLAVLTGYFDDSGSHKQSPSVTMGGLIGNEAQWTALEEKWLAQLASPPPGRPPIREFKMADLQAGLEEFEGWSRGEIDMVTHDFRQIVKECGVFGYACAVSRKDWNELSHHQNLAIYGKPEGFAAINAIVNTINFGINHADETEVALVFDDGDNEPKAIITRAYDVFRRHYTKGSQHVSPRGIAFLDSSATPPLQAADMWAWEVNAHMKNCIAAGKFVDARPHMMDLVSTKRMYAKCALRVELAKMCAVQNDPSVLMEAQMEVIGIPSTVSQSRSERRRARRNLPSDQHQKPSPQQ